MRIRAKAQGDVADVRVLMAHEMETGQRKEAEGKLVPAWFIQQCQRQPQRQTRNQRTLGTGSVKKSLSAVQGQRG